ncbi:hypothetical protein E2C01_089757 [Portunus trituberculatus]|uniref:Uncharacterized protein n=1 Tax=Portunus trituberculatus TaxID=210409 RepID=A0A5B7JJN5_PORTR|nr:hypothetical protein [Portunus trituberculatus]
MPGRDTKSCLTGQLCAAKVLRRGYIYSVAYFHVSPPHPSRPFHLLPSPSLPFLPSSLLPRLTPSVPPSTALVLAGVKEARWGGEV